MPSALRGLIGQSLRSSAAEKASVPSLPTSSRARLPRPAAQRRRRQRIQVVAADAAELRGEARRDLLRLPRAERTQALDQLGSAGRHVGTEVVRQVGKAEARSVRQQRVDGGDVVRHQPVADRLRAAGIVAGHAADGAARPGGRVDGEEQPLRLQRLVQGAERDARLHRRAARFGVQANDLSQVLGAVQHECAVHGLAALRGAAAARQDRNALVPAERHRRLDIGDAARHQHAHRLHLVDRGIGGIAAAVGSGPQHLARGLAPQALGQAAVADAGMRLRDDVHAALLPRPAPIGDGECSSRR